MKNRYRVKCATKGGTARHVIAYAPSAPKAKAKVLDGHRGVGNARITSVLEIKKSDGPS